MYKNFMQKKYPGILISFEGIDGCGKSTLAHALAEHIKAQGKPVLLTKEPGGSTLGTHLRTIVQTSKEHLCAEAEFLLYAADRAQHMQTIIIPALHEGEIIISDRMNDSSVAYQGYGRGLDIAMIKKINAWVMKNPHDDTSKELLQDLIFFIDIDPQTAMNRIIQRNEQITRFEQEKIDFWQRVRTGYQAIFKNRPEVVTLDGTDTQNSLLEQSINTLKNRKLI